MPRLRMDPAVHRLAERLGRPLPGVSAQMDMAPVYRQDPDMASIRDKTCRDAAVLALLHGTGDTLALLFIERPGHLAHHGGQIAFPGGAKEGDESLQATALRETHEEIGVPPDAVSVIGALTPLYVPPSRFCVHPFVGYTPELPALVPEAGEVARIFSLPVARLTDSGSRSEVRRHLGDRAFEVPCFALDGVEIWGATAMMLAELVAVIRDSAG